MGLFDGKVAAITGAGGGIGRAYALAFAREGAKVVVNDLGGSRDGTGSGSTMAEKVVAEIKEMGGEAAPSFDNVATEEGAANIVKVAVDNFGRLDILVNNAGILRDKTLFKLTPDLWDPVINVHLKGTYLCTRAAAMQMKEQGEGGRVINTSSIAGLMGNFGQCNYSAAKAGIAGFTRTAALELRRPKITVNCIAPVAKTRMTDDIDAVPGEAKPEFIAPIVLFLASDLAADITGRIFGVHGNHLFEYKMEMTRGVDKGEEMWKPSEIKERLKDISRTEAEYVKAEAAKAGPPAAVDPATKALKVFEAMASAFLPDKAGDWKAVLHFEIDGAGDLTMKIADGKISVAKGKEGDATCVIKLADDTFFGMAEGKVDGTQAFMQGKITATNMGDMIKYGTCFDQKKAQAAVKEALAGAGAPAAEDKPAAAEEKPRPVGLNRDCLGNKYVSAPFFVTTNRTTAYAKATNDENPYYLDESRDGGIVAPVIFPVRVLHPNLEVAVLDPELNADLVMLLHGEQDMTFHEPIRPGDCLVVRSEISYMEKKESGEILDITGVCLRDNKPVVEAVSRCFIRNRDGGKKKSKPKETPALPELLFEGKMKVREDQTKDYAEASGDHNPIHLDPEVGKAAGHGGIILHGLCTMAFASQAVVEHAAGGDPTRIKRFKVRFSKPVKPGDEVTTQAWKVDETADVLTLGFRVITQNGDVVVTDGVAEVAKA